MNIYMIRLHLTQIIVSLIAKCEWGLSVELWDCTFSRDWTSSPTRRRKPPHCRQFPSQPGSITAEPHLHKTWHVLFTGIYWAVCTACTVMNSHFPRFLAFRALPVVLQEDLTVYCRQNWLPLPIPPQLVQQQWLPLFTFYGPLYSLCGR